MRHRVIFLFLLALQAPVLGAPLQLDHNQSRIEVAVNSTAGAFTCKLQKFEATIEYEPSQPMPSKVEVQFDFIDLKTGIERRDEHMLKWVDYSQNPTATFRLKSWKQEGEDSFAVGELSIRGVHKEVRFPVKIKHDGNQYEIDGTAHLDYRDFGLPKIRSALVFSVDPHLRVQFHLAGKTKQD